MDGPVPFYPGESELPSPLAPLRMKLRPTSTRRLRKRRSHKSPEAPQTPKVRNLHASHSSDLDDTTQLQHEQDCGPGFGFPVASPFELPELPLAHDDEEIESAQRLATLLLSAGRTVNLRFNVVNPVRPGLDGSLKLRILRSTQSRIDTVRAMFSLKYKWLEASQQTEGAHPGVEGVYNPLQVIRNRLIRTKNHESAPYTAFKNFPLPCNAFSSHNRAGGRWSMAWGIELSELVYDMSWRQLHWHELKGPKGELWFPQERLHERLWQTQFLSPSHHNDALSNRPESVRSGTTRASKGSLPRNKSGASLYPDVYAELGGANSSGASGGSGGSTVMHTGAGTSSGSSNSGNATGPNSSAITTPNGAVSDTIVANGSPNGVVYDVSNNTTNDAIGNGNGTYNSLGIGGVSSKNASATNIGNSSNVSTNGTTGGSTNNSSYNGGLSIGGLGNSSLSVGIGNASTGTLANASMNASLSASNGGTITSSNNLVTNNSNTATNNTSIGTRASTIPNNGPRAPPIIIIGNDSTEELSETERVLDVPFSPLHLRSALNQAVNEEPPPSEEVSDSIPPGLARHLRFLAKVIAVNTNFLNSVYPQMLEAIEFRLRAVIENDIHALLNLEVDVIDNVFPSHEAIYSGFLGECKSLIHMANVNYAVKIDHLLGSTDRSIGEINTSLAMDLRKASERLDRLNALFFGQPRLRSTSEHRTLYAILENAIVITLRLVWVIVNLYKSVLTILRFFWRILGWLF